CMVGANAEVGELAFAEHVEMSVVGRYFSCMEQKQVLIVWLESFDLCPMTRSVVVGQCDEVDTRFTRGIKKSVRRNLPALSFRKLSAPIAVSGMRVEVTGKPSGFVEQDREGRTLVLQLLDSDGIAVGASFPDIRYSKDYRPFARLDRSWKIAVA